VRGGGREKSAGRFPFLKEFSRKWRLKRVDGKVELKYNIPQVRGNERKMNKKINEGEE